MLDQRLRHWPTLNQHLVSVLCWLGLTVNMLEVNCFQTPMVTDRNITFCVTTQSPHKRNGELFAHRCRSSI